MHRLIASVCLACLLLVVPSGAAFASCAESVGLLAKRVKLIGDASALAADPQAPLGPGDTLLTLENPDLQERARTAFDVFRRPPAQAREGAAGDFSENLARAREALEEARTALDAGDALGCERAVTEGFAAAHQARFWLADGAGPS